MPYPPLGELLKTITPPEEHPGLFDDPFGEDTLLFLPGATRRRRRRDIDASSLSDLADPAGAPRAGAEDTDWSDRFSPGDTELVMDPITPADDGLYTCTASNEHGRASIQVAVQVLGESEDGGCDTGRGRWPMK